MVIGSSENHSSVYSCFTGLIQSFYLFSLGHKLGRVELLSFEIHVAKLSNFGCASVARLFSLPFNAAGKSVSFQFSQFPRGLVVYDTSKQIRSQALPDCISNFSIAASKPATVEWSGMISSVDCSP